MQLKNIQTVFNKDLEVLHNNSLLDNHQITNLVKFIGKEKRGLDRKIGFAKKFVKLNYRKEYQYSPAKALQHYRQDCRALMTYINKSQGSGNKEKFTYSAWIKRSGLGAVQTIANMWADSSNLIELRFDLQDNLSFYAVNSSSYVLELETNAVFRDPSAFYNIVVKVLVINNLTYAVFYAVFFLIRRLSSF